MGYFELLFVFIFLVLIREVFAGGRLIKGRV